MPATIIGESGSDDRFCRLDVKKGCYNNIPASSYILTAYHVSVRGQEGGGKRKMYLFVISASIMFPQLVLKNVS